MAKNGIIKKARSIVLSHLEDERFGVNKLAGELHLSRSQTLRRIKDVSGKSANCLIREIRLEESLKLLHQSDLNISQIAYKVGFNSPSYFNKCFHDKYGVTPGEFRSNPMSLEKKLTPAAKSHPPVNKTKVRWMAAITVLVGIAITVLVNVFFHESTDKNLEAVPMQSTAIAVLPLLDHSTNSDHAHISSGLTDAINKQISRGTDLQVISKTSTMIYQQKERPYTEIAENLGVELLIDGYVQFYSDSVRITIQLIRLLPEESRLWINTYDREVSDIYKVSDDISASIAMETAQSVYSLPGESSNYQVRPEAYELFLMGKYLLQQEEGEALPTALDHFRQSIALDSMFAPAYVALAECLMAQDRHMNTTNPYSSDNQANRTYISSALDKASILDPNLDEVYISKAKFLDIYSWDWKGMKTMAEKGLALNPNSSYGHLLVSHYSLMSRQFSDAIKSARKAEILDPLNPNTCTYLAHVYMSAGQYTKAIRQFETIVHSSPRHIPAWQGLAFAHYLSGDVASAKNTWAQLHRMREHHAIADFFNKNDFETAILHYLNHYRKNTTSNSPSPSFMAITHLLVNRKQDALTLLEIAHKQRSEDLPLLLSNPIFDELKNNPRFASIAEKIYLN